MNSRRYFVLLLVSLSTFISCVATEAPPQPSPSATAAGPAPASPAARRVLRTRALEAYRGKNFGLCASLYERLGDHYRAGSCYAQVGNHDAAFAQIALAADGKIRDFDELELDADFAALAEDPRWTAARERLAARLAEEARSHNPELLRLYREDQADRLVGPSQTIDWSQVGPRDERRRAEVEAILAAGGAQSSLDHSRAALVYQHGSTVEDIQRAHDLAKRAVELDPENDGARWLAAAAEDRVLMYQEKPQKWGTQFRKIDGAWVVWEVDPAITDAQRAEQNVPSLVEAKARAARMNAPRPASP